MMEDQELMECQVRPETPEETGKWDQRATQGRTESLEKTEYRENMVNMANVGKKESVENRDSLGNPAPRDLHTPRS